MNEQFFRRMIEKTPESFLYASLSKNPLQGTVQAYSGSGFLMFQMHYFFEKMALYFQLDMKKFFGQ